ncbi:MAG: DEAD/DEAH box helicase [Limisphaerales bacterium]
MTTKLFSELGLSAEVLKAIDKMGFEQTAPIQSAAIPVLMAGHDVVGQSQTGSGKTAAFAIPAIEKVDPRSREVQVLVLCPTRELAVQVSEEVHKLAIFKRGINALPIYGGQSYERQFYGLKQGAQIVIGTPGRVMDHMRRGTLRLAPVKMVILDEADVMLDMGFREDIEFILQAVPVERQTVFFSATMPPPIRELIEKYSREPQSVRIEQRAMTVPTVEQVYYEVDRRFKIELLTRLIDIHDYKLGIVFCNTKRMVDELVDHLNAQGYSADRLHGDMSQMMRDRVMNRFRKSGLEFLVATDVAARGIDVNDVQVVINYDLPYDPEDYVHRIGRTGRAGRSGNATTFVSGRELFQIRHIERFTNMRIQRGRVPTLHEVDEARTDVFLGKLRTLLQGGEFKRQDRLIERLLEEGFSSTDIASALLHQVMGGEAAPAPRPAREDERPLGPRPPAPAPSVVPSANAFPPRPVVTRRLPRDEGPARPRSSPPRPAPASPTRLVPVKRPPPPPEAAPVPGRTIPAPGSGTGPVAAVADAPPAGSVIPIPKAPVPTARLRSGRSVVAPRAVAVETGQPRPPSRRTPGNQARLWMGVGTEMGVSPGDVVGAILGETGLPASVVGVVDIRERHLFVDVAAEYANGIIAKLNRSQIRGHRLRVKAA